MRITMEKLLKVLLLLALLCEGKRLQKVTIGPPCSCITPMGRFAKLQFANVSTYLRDDAVYFLLSVRLSVFRGLSYYTGLSDRSISPHTVHVLSDCTLCLSFCLSVALQMCSSCSLSLLYPTESTGHQAKSDLIAVNSDVEESDDQPEPGQETKITHNSEFHEEDLEVFQPTSSWQAILPGQAIPAGLHVRMNLQTGLKEAKLMDGDDGSKYQQVKKPKTRFIKVDKDWLSKEHLQAALKDFRDKFHDENLETSTSSNGLSTEDGRFL